MGFIWILMDLRYGLPDPERPPALLVREAGGFPSHRELGARCLCDEGQAEERMA